MSQNIQYSLVNPLTNQSSYSEGDVIDFIVTIPTGMQMRKNSIRLNGRVNVQCINTVGGNLVNISADDKVYINGNVGAHGFFNNWNVEFLNGVQETITEYGRYVAAKSEASKFYLDTVQDTGSLIELKSMSDSGVSNQTNYIALTQDDEVDNSQFAGFTAFSIKPHICVNLSDSPIPSSKVQTIKVKLQLEQAYKIMTCDNPLVTKLAYNLKEVNLTYICEPEQASKDVVMERVMVQANNTVVGSMANLQSVSPAPFMKLFMTFLDTTHVNNSNSFQWDYFKSEVLSGINRCEFTVNSVDATYSYPLLSNDEILYNYLSCFGSQLDKHSLDLAKLRDPTLPCGFGIGTKFFYLVPTDSNVSVDIDLNQAPNNPVRVFTFYITAISI